MRKNLILTALAAVSIVATLAFAVPPLEDFEPPVPDAEPAPPPSVPTPAPPPPSPPPPSPPGEEEPPPVSEPVHGPCTDGAPPLEAAEVQRLLERAALALDAQVMTVAAVDRAGRVLGVFRKPAAPAGNDDLAVGLARTGAFFSHDQAPLSSRTVRFLSGVHFPPGVARTSNAALYGIEQTNRGCDLNLTFAPGKDLPRATRLAGGLCDVTDNTGCGTGPVTGKPQPFDTHDPGGTPNHKPGAIAVNAGGLPIYRAGRLVGGLGIAGVPSDHAEFAALAALAANPDGLAPVPASPLPAPGAVIIDGIRLPFVRQTDRPGGTAPQTAPLAGSFVVPPAEGGCVPDGDLLLPPPPTTLTPAQVQMIVQQSIAAANRTRGVIRLPLGSRARMVIAVSDAAGRVLAIHRMRDATVFSVDVAVAKARNVVQFSSTGLPNAPPGLAVTNRTIGFGAQPLYPPGIDDTGPGPFFGLFQGSFVNVCSQGGPAADRNQNGIVFFAGSMPLYAGSTLVGGLGISGDGVEQDDYVAFLGAQGFLPPEAIRADRVKVGGVRLPFVKFPRNPEG